MVEVRKCIKRIILSSTFIFLLSCTSKKNDFLFERILPKHSGIYFSNKVENKRDFNIFSYRNFYNGGGVSIGDINNDQLPDIYFTSNLERNRLYLNKGNFQFDDITEKAGVGGNKAWSTGVVMVDINSDGWLDIYVCNAGYVKDDIPENELFINQKNNTFIEKSAEYGLNESGYTTHAAFFDYDLDGDLDAYILNNSFIPVNTLYYNNKRAIRAQDWPVKEFLKGGGDKLLRNENGKFVDVTQISGIYSSLIGFGLGITVGDVNQDHFPDMYISNDFFEHDYLYINQKDGTFKEEIKTWTGHLSLSSMGADMADINNDGFPEIFVTEMLPQEEYRLKTTTLFENYSTYLLKLKRGFHYQYMHNTLQLHNQNESFSEIAWFSGIAASDWSWGALLFDADNDGYRDIYICNGIYQDVTNQDFIDFFANDIIQKMALTGEKEEMDKVIEKMPSIPQINVFFKNKQDLTFEKVSQKWGTDIPSFSNGATYGDLDNDGDLDLVVNNLNQNAFLYQNKTDQLFNRHYLKIYLRGSSENTYAIGSKILLFCKEMQLNSQLIPTRGFQSSVDYPILFGLGENIYPDSLIIIWPDKTHSIFKHILIDTTLTIDYHLVKKRTGPYILSKETSYTILTEMTDTILPFDSHREDRYIDFFQEGLVTRMLSREGPKSAVADVNHDGLEDIFIGAASGFFSQIYTQTTDGFKKRQSTTFERDSYFEDTAVAFFDADSDGDLDLFIGSGGNHQKAGSKFMQDRIYLNDGKGNFSRSLSSIPPNGLNTSVVLPFDYDLDGDLDLFVGSRSIPQQYGISPKSFLYENDGKAIFTDVTRSVASELVDLGMITDAVLVNLTGDSVPELVIVGEWISPIIFSIEDTKFKLIESNLSNYSGWWYAVAYDDVDDDGDNDLILGNRGENFYFTGTKKNPAKMWILDFDNNGTVEKIITRTVEGRDMPIPLKKALTEQIVTLKKKNLKHSEFAEKSIQELFSKELIDKAKVYIGNYFKSAVALNRGGGNFDLKPLPKEIQFSCVCDIYCTDLNQDGKKDLILGGNESGFIPQFSKLDASFGHILFNKGNGDFEKIPDKKTGLYIRADIKQFEEVKIKNEKYILVTANSQKPKLLKINSPH